MSTSLFQIIPPSWVSLFEKSLILNLHFPIFLYVVRVCQSQPTSTGSPNYGMDTVIMERVTFFYLWWPHYSASSGCWTMWNFFFFTLNGLPGEVWLFSAGFWVTRYSKASCFTKWKKLTFNAFERLPTQHELILNFFWCYQFWRYELLPVCHWK